MKESAAGILDLSLLTAMFIIGAMMITNCLVSMSARTTDIVGEDKTAVQNFTNSDLKTHRYDTTDALLMLCVVDEYAPYPYALKIADGNSGPVLFDDTAARDADIDFDGQLPFIETDRKTYLQNHWSPATGNLKQLCTNALVEMSLVKEGDTLKWLVTIQ